MDGARAADHVFGDVLMAGIDVSFYPQANPNQFIDTAQGFMNLANSAAQNRLLGVNTQQAHQDLVRQQVGSLVDVFSSLATDPNVNYDTFVQKAQTLLKQGVIDPNTYQSELAMLPKQGAPADYQKIANGYLSRALDAGQRFGVETGMAPGSAGDIVTYTDPATGATVTTTRGRLVGAIGAPNQLTGTTATTQSTASSGTPSAIHAASPSPQASAPGTTSPAGGIAGPSPQQQAQFAASAKQQQDDLTADANYTANLVPLTKSIALVSDPSTIIGKGSQIPNDVARILNTFGIPLGADQAKNASELDKYLTQLATSNGLAGQSVQHLEATFSANPNMDTDKVAAGDVLRTALTLNRMQHAKVAAAQAAGIRGEQYSTWASKWGAQQDPRAFGFDLMSPEAKAALRAELEKDPAAAAKFIASYNAAKATPGVFDQAAIGQ